MPGGKPMELAMIQDDVMPLEVVPHSNLDRAMYFGDGVYEVIRSYKGRIFALEDHLARFRNSLEAVDIQGVGIETVKDRVLTAFDRAGIENAKIYLHVTRGSGPRDPVETPDLPPNFYLTITELEDATEEKAQGLSVKSCPDLRWKRCDIKSLNLLPNILAKREAVKQGCDEAIFVGDQGFITEGSASAFFGICKDSAAEGHWPGISLRTAALDVNILPSVTRKYVLKCAGMIGLTVKEHSMTVQEAIEAEELFMAVTTRDIVPIVRFDGHAVSQGKPGPATQALMQAFERSIEEDIAE